MEESDTPKPVSASPTGLVFAIRALVVRAGAELDSALCGDKICLGTPLALLDRRNMADGSERGRVAFATTPAQAIGWVTLVSKDGTSNTATAAAGVDLTGSSASGGGSASSSPLGRRSTNRISANSSASVFVEFMLAAKRSVLLEKLADAELRFVLQACKTFEGVAGEPLFEPGDPPSYFYIVQTGTYRASVAYNGDERKVRDYGAGDAIGSFELLYNIPRACQVICLQAGLLWGVPQRVFEMKLKIAPPARNPTLVDFIKGLHLFSGLARAKDKIAQLIRAAQVLEFNPGDVVCRQGDAARHIYAVRAGSVITSSTSSEFQLTMKPPECFGESSLYSEDELRIRQATVTAGQGGATIMSWNVSSIESLVGFGLQEESFRMFNRKLLASVKYGRRSITEGMSLDNVDTLVEAFIEASVNEKAVIAAEGGIDEHLYIIKRGSAAVTSKSAGEVAMLKAGDFFGELCLVHSEARSGKKGKRRTSIVARSSPLILLSLRAEDVKNDARFETWREALLEQIAMEHLDTNGHDQVVTERAPPELLEKIREVKVGEGRPRRTAEDGPSPNGVRRRPPPSSSSSSSGKSPPPSKPTVATVPVAASTIASTGAPSAIDIASAEAMPLNVRAPSSNSASPSSPASMQSPWSEPISSPATIIPDVASAPAFRRKGGTTPRASALLAKPPASGSAASASPQSKRPTSAQRRAGGKPPQPPIALPTPIVAVERELLPE